ncbi:preprotein translocase subunit SecA [Candidatus Mesenet endosymbiont of Agriotes lineatus]|uniref:preprotein translocase subunit SecA n=1 Tax=Candidatus Mesenet endosymbiont of Agriotes lineatus TaxID=3077948 RepID=UPI0030D47D40
MLALAQRIFGSANQRLVKLFYKIVEQINLLEPEIQKLSDQMLSDKTKEFKEQIKNGKTVDDLLIEAFAVVREASERSLGMRHFDVQLIGGIALHHGMIAEMKTGEGKTLVATLATYLNSLTGKGVHVVTVNDYLAKRDSEWMSRLYDALGISVGCITHDMTDEKRKVVYSKDIVYSTNNELGFDYLRDNMKFSRSDVVQRGFNYAIVDEVDSILIDEARTPLIISGPISEDNKIYTKIDKIITKLQSSDYELDEKNRSALLTEDGISKVEELLKINNSIAADSSLYDEGNIIITHYIDQALRAHKLFTVDKDYIIKNGKVVIIDEFTGRMMESRRYSDGLHQALEAKEGLEIQNESQTLASITFQNYFRLYKKLAGMTGTAATESEEFWGIYKLKVMQIPTNAPVKRKDLDDEIYCTEEEKYSAVVKFIIECNNRHQPVLVGTTSIEKSEKLSRLLTENLLKHSVLNARYHEQEAHIIAQAGMPGKITIATNMAGRGTDIQLGGSAKMLAKIEIKNPDQDKEVIQKVEKDKEIVMNAGGLCVIGTERHESRRIDNQLRGRSGRQGDPGLSKFFLSLEDDLLRIFGSDKIKIFLKKLGLKKDEAVHHPWISSALEKAQKKVESKNYDIRKSLLKFDDVINEQRKVIFKRRNDILNNKDNCISSVYKNVNYSIINKITLDKCYDEESYEPITDEISRIYRLKLNFSEFDLDKDSILGYINGEVDKFFYKKEQSFSQYRDDLWNTVVKQVMIMTLDHLWREHLLALESLKHSVNLRAIGQKDPLNEFKKEAFIMLQRMLNEWQELILHRLIRFNIKDEQQHINQRFNKINDFPYTSRNDKCPCGSGKKYKHCHG